MNSPLIFAAAATLMTMSPVQSQGLSQYYSPGCDCTAYTTNAPPVSCDMQMRMAQLALEARVAGTPFTYDTSSLRFDNPFNTLIKTVPATWVDGQLADMVQEICTEITTKNQRRKGAKDGSRDE